MRPTDKVRNVKTNSNDVEGKLVGCEVGSSDELLLEGRSVAVLWIEKSDKYRGKHISCLTRVLEVPPPETSGVCLTTSCILNLSCSPPTR